MKSLAYAYDAVGNRLLGSGGPAPKTYSHDLAGNVLGDGVNQFAYDGRGLLAQAQNAWGIALYLADGLGRRVAKLTGGPLDMAGDADRDGQLTVADMRIIALMAQGKAAANPAADCDHSGTVALQDALCVQAKINGLRDNPQRYAQDALLFAYDEAGHLIGEYTPAGQAVREIVYLDGKPVVVFSGGKDYFIDTDHLGTPRAITDSTGVAVWRWDSDAFGTAPPDEDPDGDGVRFAFPLRFPGQYFDAETGLHYNMARYYAPWLGRYLQADPIGLAGGVNLYGYVGGDPVNFVDPSGLDRCYDVGQRIQCFPEGQMTPAESGIVQAGFPESNGPMVFARGFAAAIAAAANCPLFLGEQAAVKAATGTVPRLITTNFPRVTIKDNFAKKIFGSREGHLPDTPQNRKLLEDVANDPATTLGSDIHGNEWSGKTLDDGTQVWTQTRGENIINGGLNETPIEYNPQTGLSSLTRPNWK